MPMTNIEACNLALGRIGHGASRPIQSITEDSESARACNRSFDNTLQVMLREYVWPWAQVVAPLSLISSATQDLAGWEYLYQYPNDCAYLRALGDASLDYTHAPYNATRAQFRIVRAESGSGRVIAAGYPDAWAWYTATITDLSQADDTFADAFAWRLASEVALGLKADARLAQWASQQYERSIQVAVALIGSEGGQGPKALPDSMSAYGLGISPWQWSNR
jgi:hypothetical protein